MSVEEELGAEANTSCLDDVHARLAVEAAGLGIWEWDRASCQLRINATLAELLGEPQLAQSPFSHKALGELTHPDDRHGVLEAVRSCIKRGDGEFLVEHRILRRDGGVRWLWIKASTVKASAEGHIQKIAGVVQDRTDAKRNELALAAEKTRNDLALSGSHIAIWEWDINTDLVTWSPYMSEILGLPLDVRQGERSFLNLRVHPDDYDRAHRATNAFLEQGIPYDTNYRIRHEKGHYLTVRSRGQAKRDASGKIVQIAGSLVDITKEREAEAAARHLGLRSQLAVEAALLGTWELDLEAGEAVMDARLCDLLGHPELAGKALGGTAMLDFTAPEDRDIVRDLFKALIKGESEFVRDQHRVMHADGHRVWIHAQVGVAERTPEGRAVRLVGVTQDLTEQKATEQALRTAAERAEAANAAKSDFLATMSHEIRTPLNGVLGVSQLLALSDLSDKQKRYVDTLQSSGRLLTQLIDDILDISRIEAGKMALAPEDVETARWITETLAPFQTLAQEKGLGFSLLQAEGSGARRFFDPNRMAQIIGNLTSNAIKFTQSGDVIVKVSAPSTDRLRLEVTDTGPGIAEADTTRIFDRFSQGDMSPRREHGGSGLGLAIARELTELAGGEIGVASTPGQGSRFWFEIPAPCLSDAPERKASDRPAPTPSRRRRGLIVEDNAINRETLAEMLRLTGIDVDLAHGGEAALNRMEAERFDVVLLDLHMPGMGGFETLKAIRANGRYGPDTPVLIVSADATPDAQMQATRLGAQGFLTKPVDMTTLIDVVESLEAVSTGD